MAKCIFPNKFKKTEKKPERYCLPSIEGDKDVFILLNKKNNFPYALERSE